MDGLHVDVLIFDDDQPLHVGLTGREPGERCSVLVTFFLPRPFPFSRLRGCVGDDSIAVLTRSMYAERDAALAGSACGAALPKNDNRPRGERSRLA